MDNITIFNLKDRPKEGDFIVRGLNYNQDKYFLSNGKFYHYEFCGNPNWIKRNGPINTPRKKKDEYGFVLIKF